MPTGQETIAPYTVMMGVMIDWDDHTEQSKLKRARNRSKSAEVLGDHGFEFTSHNNGAHLVVTVPNLTSNGLPGVWDFWPGTGKFIRRAHGTYGRGVFNLVNEMAAAMRKANGPSYPKPV